MEVELIDVMGDDLMVVNAARVSYAKRHEHFDREGDAKLLRYLATHGHWSPFSHPHLTFRVKTTIASARQLYRHQVGLAVNEVSRRYVDDPPEYDFPTVWRGRPAKGQSKQGSTGEVDDQEIINDYVRDVARACGLAYEWLLEKGVAPEQARMVLPMGMCTEWYWTGSLMAFIRICKDRVAPDAQKETREIAQEFLKAMRMKFPHSCDAWDLP